MLSSKSFVEVVCASFVCLTLCSHSFAQDGTKPIGEPNVHPQPIKLDAKEHMQIVATATRDSVKVTSIKRGNGPPRAYLSQQTTVVVLLKGKDGRVLSRTQLADPLELRVMEPDGKIPRPPKALVAKPQVREHVMHVASNQLRLYLPLIPQAVLVEFHANEDSGKVLGTATIPPLR